MTLFSRLLRHLSVPCLLFHQFICDFIVLYVAGERNTWRAAILRFRRTLAGEVAHSEVGPKTTVAARPSSLVNSRFPEVSVLAVLAGSGTADRVPRCRSFIGS